METSKISDATLPESETILLARGPRRIQLQMVDFADTNQWFTCSPVSPGTAYASFQLMIQAGSCDPGLYRVVIPVICRHSTEVPELSDSSWVASWSIQASMAIRPPRIDTNLLESLAIHHSLKHEYKAFCSCSKV